MHGIHEVSIDFSSLFSLLPLHLCFTYFKFETNVFSVDEIGMKKREGVPPSRVWRGFKRISRNWPARISTIALSVERVTQKFAAAYRDREEEFEKVPVSELAAFFPGHKGLHAREMHLASIPIRRRVMRPGSRPSFVVNNERTNKNQRFCLSIFIYSSMFPACLGHYNLATSLRPPVLYSSFWILWKFYIYKILFYVLAMYLYKIYLYICTCDLYFLYSYTYIPKFLYSFFIHSSILYTSIFL